MLEYDYYTISKHTVTPVNRIMTRPIKERTTDVLEYGPGLEPDVERLGFR